MEGGASIEDNLPKGFAPVSLESLFRAVSLVSGEPGPEDNPLEERRNVMSLHYLSGDELTFEETIQRASTSGSRQAEDTQKVDSYGEITGRDGTGQGEEAINGRDGSAHSVRMFSFALEFRSC